MFLMETVATKPTRQEMLDCRIPMDLAGEELRQNFEAAMADWAVRPPTYIGLGDTLQVVAGRYADVMEIFKDRERFSVEIPSESSVADRFLGMMSLAQLDGSRHDRLRRLMAPAFSPAAINRKAPLVESVVDEMIRNLPLSEEGEFELMGDFAMHLVVRVLLAGMLGMETAEIGAFVAAGDAITRASQLRPSDPVPDDIGETFATSRVTVESLIARRRVDPADDLISMLVTARDADDKMSDTELFDQIFITCAAALTTTAGSMGGLLLSLGRNPDQFDQVKADPSLIPQTVEEGLRRHGPGYLPFARFAVDDAVVGGTFIPKGTAVFPSFQAACYDPVAFPDPLRFDIHRRPKGILIFGAGTHHCLGQVLARLILQTALRRLLVHFPKLALADPEARPVYHGEFGEALLVRLQMTTR